MGLSWHPTACLDIRAIGSSGLREWILRIGVLKSGRSFHSLLHRHHTLGILAHRGVKNICRKPNCCMSYSEYHKLLAPFFIAS